MSEIVNKKDFIELEYTGYSNGEVFDSNISEDLKKVNKDASVEECIIVVGEGMVVPGLDKALEGKEIGKEYELEVPWKEGFGERKRDLIRIIPLSSFTEKKVNPRPGMVLALDQSIVKILSVSGARVTTDFNNPLAGKDLNYKFTAVRKVTELRDKVKCVFESILKFVPEYAVEGEKVFIKGPTEMKGIVEVFGARFKELIGKDLGFKEVKKGELVKKVADEVRSEPKLRE